jgi:hypothetical protein
MVNRHCCGYRFHLYRIDYIKRNNLKLNSLISYCFTHVRIFIFLNKLNEILLIKSEVDFSIHLIKCLIKINNFFKHKYTFKHLDITTYFLFQLSSTKSKAKKLHLTVFLHSV